MTMGKAKWAYIGITLISVLASIASVWGNTVQYKQLEAMRDIATQIGRCH